MWLFALSQVKIQLSSRPKKMILVVVANHATYLRNDNFFLFRYFGKYIPETNLDSLKRSKKTRHSRQVLVVTNTINAPLAMASLGTCVLQVYLPLITFWKLLEKKLLITQLHELDRFLTSHSASHEES